MTRIEKITRRQLATVEDQIELAQAIIDDPKQNLIHSMAQQSIAVFQDEKLKILYALAEDDEP